LRAKPARYLRAELDKTFAAGLNVQAMEDLAHRKGRGLEAVAMRPAANLPHLEIARAATFMFLSQRARSPLSRQALPQKCCTATRRAKKSRSGPIPFLHFPAFGRNMT
jgi:hypothetical protein